MPPLSIRSYRSPLIQILVWLMLGLLLLLFQPLSWQASLQITLPEEFWIKQAILFFFLVGIFYLNAWLWVPRLLFHNKISWFIIAVVLTAIVLMLIIKMVEAWLNLPELMHRAFHPNSTEPSRRGNSWFDFFVLLLSFLVLGISTSVKTVQKWQKDVQLRQSLEKQKISSELSFLKAQINPHFFFNTLNNIYALTLSDIETARQALHNLSRMMRYVLYETRKDVTLLSQEIAFLQDYIKLMQLRLTDKVKVSFEHPTSLNDMFMAPMLFLPFVENAFKHGVSSQSPSCIHIQINQQGHRLHLEVRNTIFTSKSVLLEESSGIGLANTRRRLDLLYPNNYSLLVDEHAPENTFLVKLTLNLA
ncbi:sensor histidine kinase [Catalinimonas niigatensis]|uniref:sensor histidine kinase n=1 Tax=Catalinimonas niigatensis TaxID=1397264 RepID=UPI0026652074|nr:histidine kinase [Catalinimonas niigatensis]WPP49860.1 histidine kinase [Catalinimonas niigatensis]